MTWEEFPMSDTQKPNEQDRGTGTGLNAQPCGQRADEITRLENKLSDVTMDNELPQEKIERLQARAPSSGRRSK